MRSPTSSPPGGVVRWPRPAPCPATGTPIPPTTPSRWTASSGTPGSGWRARTRSRSPGATWPRPWPTASRSCWCGVTTASCGPSSTSVATVGRRWPRAAARPAPSPARTTPGCTGSTAPSPGPRASAPPRASTPTTTGWCRWGSRPSPAASWSTSTPTPRRSTRAPWSRVSPPYRLDDLELGRTDRYEAAFNWKVLVENYSENYHTPFVHSQLIGAGYEYPMETTGDVVFAWDRPLGPRDASEEALATSSPGGPGWEAVAGDLSPESFNNGSYLTVFPNTMVSVFAGFAATFRLTPTGPTTTTVERDYLWHPSVGQDRRDADYEATKEVVLQDLGICEAVQRTYDGGLSADGVLSTEHERGVHHVHQLLFDALAQTDPWPPAPARTSTSGGPRSWRPPRRSPSSEAWPTCGWPTWQPTWGSARGWSTTTSRPRTSCWSRCCGRWRPPTWPAFGRRGRQRAIPSTASTGCCGSTCPTPGGTSPGPCGSTGGTRPCAARRWPPSPRSSTRRGWPSSRSSSSPGWRTASTTARTPTGAAWRLSALLDGLAIQVVLPRRTLSRRQMLDHARVGAAREVGLARSAFPD